MTKILFIGDIVGETGLAYLEAHLPELIRSVEADFVVANAENLDLTPSRGGCGMTPPSLRRLFATGIDLVTGGNHSFDAPDHSVHDDVRILRLKNFYQVKQHFTVAPAPTVPKLDLDGRRRHCRKCPHEKNTEQ